MRNRDGVHVHDLIDRAQKKISFLSSIDDRQATIDGDLGLFWLLTDIDQQLKEALNLIDGVVFCTHCNGQPKEE